MVRQTRVDMSQPNSVFDEVSAYFSGNQAEVKKHQKSKRINEIVKMFDVKTDDPVEKSPDKTGTTPETKSIPTQSETETTESLGTIIDLDKMFEFVFDTKPDLDDIKDLIPDQSKDRVKYFLSSLQKWNCYKIGKAKTGDIGELLTISYPTVKKTVCYDVEELRKKVIVNNIYTNPAYEELAHLEDWEFEPTLQPNFTSSQLDDIRSYFKFLSSKNHRHRRTIRDPRTMDFELDFIHEILVPMLIPKIRSVLIVQMNEMKIEFENWKMSMIDSDDDTLVEWVTNDPHWNIVIMTTYRVIVEYIKMKIASLDRGEILAKVKNKLHSVEIENFSYDSETFHLVRVLFECMTREGKDCSFDLTDLDQDSNADTSFTKRITYPIYECVKYIKDLVYGDQKLSSFFSGMMNSLSTVSERNDLVLIRLNCSFRDFDRNKKSIIKNLRGLGERHYQSVVAYVVLAGVKGSVFLDTLSHVFHRYIDTGMHSPELKTMTRSLAKLFAMQDMRRINSAEMILQFLNSKSIDFTKSKNELTFHMFQRIVNYLLKMIAMILWPTGQERIVDIIHHLNTEAPNYLNKQNDSLDLLINEILSMEEQV